MAGGSTVTRCPVLYIFRLYVLPEANSGVGLPSALISIKEGIAGRHIKGLDLPVGVAEMIALADCLAMCGLSEDEVLAIAEHEHIPEIAAAALAQYLLNLEHGPAKIRDMIRDNIRQALVRNDREHARKLFMALRHFLSEHQTCGRHAS